MNEYISGLLTQVHHLSDGGGRLCSSRHYVKIIIVSCLTSLPTSNTDIHFSNSFFGCKCALFLKRFGSPTYILCSRPLLLIYPLLPSEPQSCRASLINSLRSLGRNAMGDPFGRQKWERGKEDAKWRDNSRVSLAPFSTYAPPPASPPTIHLTPSSSNEQSDPSTRRVRLKGHNRHSSIPLLTRMFPTTPTALRDETKGPGLPQTARRVTSMPGPGYISSRKERFASLSSNETSMMSTIPPPSSSTDGKQDCKPRFSSLQILGKTSNRDMYSHTMSREKRRERLLSAYSRRQTYHPGSIVRFSGSLVDNKDGEGVPIRLLDKQQETGKKVECDSLLPKPSSSHSGGVKIDGRNVRRRSDVPEMPAFQHDTIGNLPQKRLLSFSAAESLSRLNASGSNHGRLRLSTGILGNSSTGSFASSHVSSRVHENEETNAIINGACSIPSIRCLRKVQVSPLDYQKPPLTFRPWALRDEASQNQQTQTSAHYPVSRETSRIRQELSSIEKGEELKYLKYSKEGSMGVVKASHVEEQSHSISHENPLKMQTEENAEYLTVSIFTPKSAERHERRQREKSERMVRPAPIVNPQC